MTIGVNLHGITKMATQIYYHYGNDKLSLLSIIIGFTVLFAIVMGCRIDHKYVTPVCFWIAIVGTLSFFGLFAISFETVTPAYILRHESIINETTAKSLSIDKINIKDAEQDPSTDSSKLIWKDGKIALAKIDYNGGSTLKLKPINNTGKAYLTVAKYLKSHINDSDQVKLNVQPEKTVATVDSANGRKQITCYANSSKPAVKKTENIVLKME